MKENQSCTVYVVSHKKYQMPQQSCYQPLLVGASRFEEYSDFDGYLRDNSGDESISDKNKFYCELTGLHWIWKNSVSDIVGLVHYRRYFTLRRVHGKNKLEKILTESEINGVLESHDIILARKRHYYIETVQSQYGHAHHPEDLVCARDVIQQLYPDYIDAFDLVMNRRSLYLYNMFICRNFLMKEYCSWLFPILEEIEKKLDISKYSDNDKRVFGFLSERLFNVWVLKNNLKIAEMPVANLENQHWFRKLFNFALRKVGIKK